MNQVINFKYIVLISFLLINCDGFILETKMKNVLKEFINYSNSREFERAACLFHFDPTQSNENIKIRKKTIIQIIESISDNYGNMHIINSTPDSVYFELGISGCDSAYLADKPFIKAGIFPVKYEKVGEGWLEIQILVHESEVKIRKLIYEIPIVRKEAEINI